MMQVKRLKDADRRWLIKAGSASLVLSLTACQSVLDIGQTAGDGKSGEFYLASIRSDHGLPPLHSDPKLERAALQQAPVKSALLVSITRTNGFRAEHRREVIVPANR